MGTIRAIIYDSDRTLVWPHPQAPEIWDSQARELGMDLARERRLPEVDYPVIASLLQVLQVIEV